MSIYSKLKGINASKIKNEGLKAQIVKAQEGFTEKSLEDEKIKAVVEKAISLVEKSSPEAMPDYVAPKAAEPKPAPAKEEKAEAPKKKPAAERAKSTRRTKKAATKSRTKKATPAKAKAEPKPKAEKPARATKAKKATTDKPAKPESTAAKIWKIAKSEGITYSAASKKFKAQKEEATEIAKMKKSGDWSKATSGTNIEKDKQRDALPAGKRTSITGKTYYEYRANRTDRNPRLRLEMGGEIEGGYQVGDNFVSDHEKMSDYFDMTKQDFLASYDYMTEQEYDNTSKLVSEKGLTKENFTEEQFAKGGAVDSYPVLSVSNEEGEELNLSRFPNFSKSGSVKGMKDKYYGKDALLIKSGNYIYNVTSEPEVYDTVKTQFAKGGSISGKNTEVILTENRPNGAEWRGVVKPFMLKSIEENQYSGGFKRYEIDIYDDEVQREPSKEEIKEANNFFDKVGGRFAKGGSITGKTIDTEELHENIVKAIEAVEASEDYGMYLTGEDPDNPTDLVLFDTSTQKDITSTSQIKDPKVKAAVEAVFEEIEEHNEDVAPESEPTFVGKEINQSEGLFSSIRKFLPFMN